MKLLVTVDVERDPFGVGSPTYHGLELGFPQILGSLRDAGLRATMFFSGEVAESHPETIRIAASEGHEVGCHGFDHSLGYLNRQPPDVVARDIVRGRRAIEASIGSQPSLFRAPNFSADLAVLREVANAGFTVDSSILPGRLVRRWRFLTLLDQRGTSGVPHYPLAPVNQGHGTSLLEVPLTPTTATSGAPVGLGLVNSHGADSVLSEAKAVPRSYVMFLAHPWEAINLASFQTNAPAWVRRACQSSLVQFDRFLESVAQDFDVVTMTTVAREWRARLGTA